MPFRQLSDGAVRAVEDIGFNWVLGRANRELAAVEVVEPVTPFDTRLLEESRGAVRFEGEMIDIVHIKRGTDILERARAFDMID